VRACQFRPQDFLVDPQVTELEDFDKRILRGRPTLTSRQVALPVRLPLPGQPDTDSIFEDQPAVAGRSFG
jgi:hypothetical protein